MLNVLNPFTNDLSEFKNMGTYIYNLAYLQQTKIVKVPTFICIPNDAIYYSLGEEPKKVIWETISDFRNNKITSALASDKIIKVINNVKLPKDYLYELSLAISKYLGAKQGDSFVIKNSFYWPENESNDLISNSDFGTCINVSYDNIADAMLYAYSSIYSSKILDFMKKTNFSVNFPKNNIIIQTMIDVDVSCIVTPVNSRDEIINERLIMAKIGKNIAQGEKIIEHYHYNTTDGQFFNDNLSEYELLSPNQLQELMNLSNFIFDKLYKNYFVNIKFVISNDNIYVLNIHQNSFKDSNLKFTIDGSFVPLNRRNVCSDLTFSILNDYENRTIKSIYYNVYNDKLLYDENITNLDNLLAFYKNNIYYDTRRTSVLVKTLPFSNTIYPMWENILKLKQYNYRIEEGKINQNTLKQKHKKAIQTIDKNTKTIFSNIENIYSAFDNQFNNNFDLNSCKQCYNNLINSLAPNMAYKYINVVYLQNEIFELREKLKKDNINEQLINTLINELTNCTNTPLENSLNELSNLARDNMGIRNILMQITSIENFNQFIKNENELTIKIKNFLLKFGDITPYFNKIEAVNYKDNPCILINEILNRTNNTSQLDVIMKQQNLEKLLSKKPYSTLISKIKELSYNKAMFDYYEKMLNAKIRKIFLLIGVNYKKENLFDDITDVVFLNLKEIFGGKNPNFRMLVQSRKEVYTLNSRIPTFEKIIFNREKN